MFTYSVTNWTLLAYELYKDTKLVFRVERFYGVSFTSTKLAVLSNSHE